MKIYSRQCAPEAFSYLAPVTGPLTRPVVGAALLAAALMGPVLVGGSSCVWAQGGNTATGNTATGNAAAGSTAAGNTQSKGGGITYSAAKMVYRTNGVRLEGAPGQPARVKSPEMEVVAGAIALDIKDGKVGEVRAVENVKFKLAITPKDGGAPVAVDATCARATLEPATRKLVLDGGITGYYQLSGGPRNSLKGQKAEFSLVEKQMGIDVSGGKENVELTLPPEAGDKPGNLGTVKVTGRNFSYSEASGLARLTGGAHAFSLDGPNQFDVTAPEFTITRGRDGNLSVLKSVGSTTVKVDFPPPPAPKPAAAAPAAETPKAGAAKAPAAAQIGRPTRVEATADSATVDRDTNTVTFDGNVRGFYTLANAGQMQNYKFAGARAVFKYNPAAAGDLAGGLNIDVTGVPVTVEAPGFELGF